MKILKFISVAFVGLLVVLGKILFVLFRASADVQAKELKESSKSSTISYWKDDYDI